ncbi:MAG: DUF1592 domain-containing protein [Verrucomicrobiales bacterium]|nr:DUF1592 domain-containing protein [Verrucomicrobiales bacterium]
MESLRVWKAFLGIGDAPVALEGHLGPEIRGVGGQTEVSGWGRPETPNMVANPTDRALRIPGNLKAKGVAMHPSPTHAVAVGWRSPVSARVRVTSAVAHAHPECGNGVTWSLEVRQGATRRRLQQGVSAGGGPAKTAEVSGLELHVGDVVSLLIGPRDGNHSCDLTDVDLVIETESEAGAAGAVPRWSLTADVASDVLAGNPHADRQGNPGVWHFYAEPVQGGDSGWTVPEGSILARWHAVEAGPERDRLAQAFQELLIADSPAEATPAADRRLRDEILSLHGPLLSSVRRLGLKLPQGTTPYAGAEAYGLDPARFGRDPEGNEVEGRSLAVRAPSVVEVRFPAEMIAGAELVTTARLDPVHGREGTVQVQLTSGTVTERQRLQAGEPILVHPGSEAESRVSAGMETLRQWFPAAVCYPRVVPVDEVVTLALYHREDESLKRLMLDDAGRVAIDRLWDELHFISHDALGLVDAFQQLMEYATQDSNPALFEPMRKPIMEGAETFRARLRSAEPAHWEALLRFVERAYRRPLDDAGRAGLRTLYDRLRASDLPPEEAFRSVVARVLVSPAFLYRPEVPGPGRESVSVSDWEQATRLSYFLWSTVPDDALRAAAAAGRLREPAGLLAEARRMLRDPKVRRLAVEFGCQWLHIHGFDELDEKSERHFPEFATVRGPMYEEAIRFFTDFFAEDRSVLELIDSDHAFLNETVAKHYGVPGVVGTEWRRVGGMRAVGRGGVLGLGATLAKQSGASRTSPILRGNWVAEVLLGFKLPKPPKNVPPLPEDENATEGLTLRQVVERHSSVPECAGCHRHIDAYGFALEGFDAVGRARERDAADRTIDTFVALPDGTRVSGAGGLRRYLLEQRREVFVTQFCRKLLGYALGRGVRLSDKPLLAEMQSQLAAHEYRISAALEVLLVSRQFREIRGAAVADEP